MKNTDTAKYLEVALQSLENVLIPELSTPEAKATAEVMRMVMGELLKREHFTPRLLEEQIAEGRLLVQHMTALLSELGAAEAETASPALDLQHDSHVVGDAYTQLTGRLALLASALSGRRGNIQDPAQQDYVSTLLHKAAAWEFAYYSAQREAAIGAVPPRPLGTGAPLTKTSLEAFLRARHSFGEKCTVTAFSPIPGGFGKQTFRATVSDGSGNSQSLIVRKCDPTPMIRHDGFFIDREFYLLQDVFATGFPVPQPLLLGAGVAGVDGDFYAMSALPGSVPSSFLGAATAVIPESVLLHMAELLAQLHQLKLDSFTSCLTRLGQTEILKDSVESCYHRAVAEWKRYYENGEHLPSPYLTYLLDWLEQHVPHDKRRPVLVHGDFNIHNVLAQEGRITGVLDWECSMFGAPEQDLAYIKPIISNHIGWDRFLGHYHASGGPEIDERSFNFYMAFSSMRVSIAFNKGVRNLQEGLTHDIRYAVVELGLTPEFMSIALANTSAITAA